MKKLILGLAFILCFSAVFGAVIEEKTLAEIGYESFKVEGANQEKCIDFFFSKDLNLNTLKHYTFFSLKSEFNPTNQGNAKITITLNDENTLREIIAKKSLKEFERILLPRKALKEKNKLSVCGQTTNSITEIIVSNESIIGTYLAPDFSTETAFEKIVENMHPLIGQETKVLIKLKNEGSEKTNVDLNFRKSFIELEEITVVKGQTTWNGELNAGQEAVLEYVVRFNKAGSIGLPAAIATYTNAFGETESIVSNYLTVEVMGVEQKLKPVILTQQSILKPNEKTQLILAVKNSGLTPQYNISLKLKPATELVVDENPNYTIDVIQPGQTKYFEYKIGSAKEGKFEIGCSLSYLDINAITEQCEPIEIIVGTENITNTLTAGLIILLVGAIIYLYIYFK